MAKKRLNLGCGKTHLPGFVNIDINKDLKPDVVHNFVSDPLPYENQSVDEIVISHVIEHIPKNLHASVLRECFRVLKHKTGSLVLAYPEFRQCAQNYIDNLNGMRDYWEATIYGRQSTIWDFHVALMDTEFYLVPLLESLGFGKINWREQPDAAYNTLLRAFKVELEPPTIESHFAKVMKA